MGTALIVIGVLAVVYVTVALVLVRRDLVNSAIALEMMRSPEQIESEIEALREEGSRAINDESNPGVFKGLYAFQDELRSKSRDEVTVEDIRELNRLEELVDVEIGRTTQLRREFNTKIRQLSSEKDRYETARKVHCHQRAEYLADAAWWPVRLLVEGFERLTSRDGVIVNLVCGVATVGSERKIADAGQSMDDLRSRRDAMASLVDMHNDDPEIRELVQRYVVEIDNEIRSRLEEHSRTLYR